MALSPRDPGVLRGAVGARAFDDSIDAGARTGGGDGFSLTGTPGRPDAGDQSEVGGSGFALGGGSETLPPAGGCGSADFNRDGDIGADADIAAFFARPWGNGPPPPCTAGADFNGDRDTGADADIAAFFVALGGGSCRGPRRAVARRRPWDGRGRARRRGRSPAADHTAPRSPAPPARPRNPPDPAR